jgi:hypothetical protein
MASQIGLARGFGKAAAALSPAFQAAGAAAVTALGSSAAGAIDDRVYKAPRPAA